MPVQFSSVQLRRSVRVIALAASAEHYHINHSSRLLWSIAPSKASNAGTGAVVMRDAMVAAAANCWLRNPIIPAFDHVTKQAPAAEY